MPDTRTWNGPAYDRISTPMERLAREVMDRLDLRGDETVLDAGCGSGRVTELLVERVPRGRVIGVDASASMIDAARERLGDEADLRRADLVGLDLGGERVDVVFSTATFHWIADHERLFERLHAALKPGGRLVAQCGGEGNIAAIRQAIEELSGDTWMPWNFAGPGETEARLRAAGFAEARAWLYERPVTPAEPLAFLKTLILGEHLERLPEQERDPFARSVLGRLGEPFVARYVRLNIEAKVNP
jgi:trans-aconitate 2-methyltransferase